MFAFFSHALFFISLDVLLSNDREKNIKQNKRKTWLVSELHYHHLNESLQNSHQGGMETQYFLPCP